MIGQEAILDKIKKNGPFLILGPKGSGKTSLAKEIIMRSLCEKRGCEECKHCRTFLNNNHPDVHILSGGKVDDVRELIGKISIKPYYEKHYVLLDDVDKMTVPAQNALLRTIEEPVSPTLFILTGTVRNRILTTILSRCLLLTPRLLSPDVILEELQKQYPDEDTAFLKEVSEYAEGSLGYAKDMIERKEFYQMLSDDIRNIKKKNFFEMASHLSVKEYKKDILIMFDFFEKHLRDEMLSFIKQGKDTTPLYEIVQEIEKYRIQLINNINSNMMFQNLILKMQKVV